MKRFLLGMIVLSVIIGLAGCDNSELEQLREESAALQGQVAELEAQVAAQEEELQASRETISTLQEERDALKSQVSELQSQLTSVTDELEQAQDANLALRTERDELQSNLRESLETSVASLNSKLDQTRARMEALLSERDELRARLDELGVDEIRAEGTDGGGPAVRQEDAVGVTQTIDITPQVESLQERLRQTQRELVLRETTVLEPTEAPTAQVEDDVATDEVLAATQETQQGAPAVTVQVNTESQATPLRERLQQMQQAFSREQ